MSTMTPTQLGAWIEDLRGRLDRGELRRRRDLEAYVWYLLQQVDGWRRATPGERAQPEARRAIHGLRADLVALYAHLHDGTPEPLALQEWRQ
jgi:hypothetical protein